MVTRRSGRVQRGGQPNVSTQQALHNVQAAMAQLASTLNQGGVDTPVSTKATEIVEKVSTPDVSATPSDAPTESPTASAQTGGKKTKKKSGKKRKLNGYMKFANTRRTALMKANPGATIGDIGKMMGAEWRNMSDAMKQAYA